ncbi:MAG: hypothetical protein UC300_04895 [Prevotella sp.]|nr:hypothetical protein [Prevotella sp.]
MNNHQDITRLIDRYMAGATTNDEEARLRAYFATAGDIPAEWAIYKALFGYVDGQRMETAHSLSTAPHRAPTHRPAPDARRRLWIGAAAAAAVVAVAVMVWPRPSASTYAVIDGKVCTDRSEVRAEALSALQTIQLEDDDDAFAALGMMERQ